MNNFNFVPSTINNDQFLAYRQSGAYMTDYRPSSDIYSYLIKNANNKGMLTGNKLRQYLQDNGEDFMDNFKNSTRKQFLNMKITGSSPNACTGAEESVIYNGGNLLINDKNTIQIFAKDCPEPGEKCNFNWLNSPIPQQGPYCSK